MKNGKLLDRPTSLLALTAAVLLASSIVVTPQTRPLVITGVNIVDVTGGRIIPNSTVQIDGTRIASVTQASASPRDARVLDARGKFLIPGLWDMHAHTEAAGESSLRLHIANGVTGIGDMGSDLELILRMREATASGRLLGPRIVAAGPILDDAPGEWPFRMRVRSADEGHIYKDDGVSGEEFAKRPNLMRLLRTVDGKPRPPFQVLVMADDSRLGREQIETAYVLKQIIEADVRVFHYLHDKERTLDGPMDKIMLSLVAFADELKRLKDGLAVYDKVAAKAKRGYVVGALTFGYDNVSVPGPTGKRSHVVRAINQAQATVVRRIFAMSAAGMGYSRIARTLNAEGALAPKPKRVRDSSGKLQATRSPGWSHSTVKVILDRRLYLGEAVWNRTKKRDKRGKKIRGRKLPLRPESEWIRTAAPPIITETEWRTAHDRLDTVRERLQGLRQDDEKRRARDVESPFLLSGFARCSQCGGSLGVLSEGRNRRRVYGCSRARRMGSCSNRLQIPIERVDDAVLSSIIDQVFTETVVEAVVDRVIARLAPNAVNRTVDELRTALQSIEREVRRVTDAIAKGGELDSLLDKLRECEKRRNDLRAAIQTRTVMPDQTIERGRLESSVRRRVEDWRELLNRRSAHGRQLLREMLAGPITFTPAGRVYQFRGEASFGALVGEAGVAPFLVPVRGFDTYCKPIFVVKVAFETAMKIA